MKRLLAFLAGWKLLGAMALVAALWAGAPAQAGVPGSCTGKFVNPITDVCWSCLFPLSIGGAPIWPSIAGRADTDNNPALPVCLCGSPVPRIGIAVGFWEPVRLVDVTVKPWCFPNLGGVSIKPGFDIGHGTYSTTNQLGGSGQNSAKWNVHWYIYPLMYWMEIVADFLCLEQSSFDIAYVTEIDPLWQDDTLTMLINPEAAVFANPIATLACAADCVAATVKRPLDVLFWCAGCQGSMYPMNGNVSNHMNPIQSSRLAASRMAYKMHRELLAWGTMGKEGLCQKYPMPIIKKQQYRFQMVNPSPMVKGKFACAMIGASDLKPGVGQTWPVVGEDFGYLVWRKRNCCML
jgi:conjugal transfer pilus assembly protein TraU